MGIIVSIGGGEVDLGETVHIDQTILDLTQKQHPHVVFVPTASHDSERYMKKVQKSFELLGASVQHLCLHKETYSIEEVEAILLKADAIYIGGGNTASMIKYWRQFEMQRILTQAYHQNIVLAGLSAGSICWYQWGHSDSASFAGDNLWEWSRVDGLGFIDACHVPHYNEPGRDTFDLMVKRYPGIQGIALDNRVALVVEAGIGRIIKDDPKAHAYEIDVVDGVFLKRELMENQPLTLKMNL